MVQLNTALAGIQFEMYLREGFTEVPVKIRNIGSIYLRYDVNEDTRHRIQSKYTLLHR